MYCDKEEFLKVAFKPKAYSETIIYIVELIFYNIID